MNTYQTTFTVLVTVTRDDRLEVSPARIAEIVQCALEEGTSCSGSYYAAQVDAFEGHVVNRGALTLAESERLSRISPLHRS